MFSLKLKDLWPRIWMRYSGLNRLGRLASYIAAFGAAPSYGRVPLARFGSHGYISWSAIIHHQKLKIKKRCFIGDSVTIYQDNEGDEIVLSEGVHIHRNTILHTGRGGKINIGAETHIQPRCQVVSFNGPIKIGDRGEIAPHCAFYSYTHGVAPGLPVRGQPLESKGGITLGNDVWLGFGVIVIDGVHIGNDAIVGAGSVVTKDIPENSIAVGNPARVVKMR